jgi:hypothetical protein
LKWGVFSLAFHKINQTHFIIIKRTRVFTPYSVGQDVGLFLIFQAYSQTTVTVINGIRCHPFDRQACLKGTLQQLTHQSRGWCKSKHPQETADFDSWVFYPAFGQIHAIDRTGLASTQKHSNLKIFHPSGCSTPTPLGRK